jgi:hypothetical protein
MFLGNLSLIAADYFVRFWLAYSFQLTDVLSHSEFTAIYDMFKIMKVEFKIQVISNPDSGVTTNSIGYVNILYYR